MKTPRPLVYILIISYNGEKYVLRLLESLFRSTYPNCRILLVDNSSTDTTVQSVRSRYPNCEIRVNAANLGFARASNIGLRQAIDNSADFILLLNQDTLVHEAMIERLVGFMASHPRAACVGPKTYFLEEGPRLTSRILYAGARQRGLPLRQYVRGIEQQDNGQYDRTEQVDYVWGHGMMLRGSMVSVIGYFDPTLFLYYEDIDLCRRIKREGGEIWYEPAAVMWHHIPDGARATESALWRWRHKVLSIHYLLRKDYGILPGTLLFVLFFMLETVDQLKAGHYRAIGHRLTALTAVPFFGLCGSNTETASDTGENH